MKKIQLNIEDLFNVPTAVIYSPDKFKAVGSVTIDSRIVKKNSLFIAIKGKRFDGHHFVNEAVKKGASTVVINSRRLAEYDEINVPIITVKDTTKALGEIAKLWRKKLSSKIVAITGSSGKTTVKDMLAELLSEKFNVNKTIENNNNHIGVPLTILNTTEKHDVLVAELGTNHFGEIPYTSEIISPDYALITNIGASHVKYLKSKTGVWKEKSSLFDETLKNNGKLFINYDDPIIKKYEVKRNKAVIYSSETRTDVYGKITKYTNDGKPVIELSGKGKKLTAEPPIYGEQSAKSFIAAAAVALELGLNKNRLLENLKKLKMPPGRLNLIRLKNIILIDDTYNANPDSTKAAIELVGKIKTKTRKILFLGDMFELGENEIKLHKEIAKSVQKIRVEEVYTIGKNMKYLCEELKNKRIKSKHFRSRNSLLNKIKEMNFDDSVILVKGSRRMRMEEFLNLIKLKAK